jgi:hypothetical protein
LKDLNNQWGWFTTDQAQALVPITAAAITPNTVEFTTGAPHGFLPFQRVKLRKFIPRYWNKTVQVRTIADINKFTIVHGFDFTPTISVNGFAQPAVTSFARFFAITPIRTVTRKSGRPFDTPVGRGR